VLDLLYDETVYTDRVDSWSRSHFNHHVSAKHVRREEHLDTQQPSTAAYHTAVLIDTGHN